MGKDVSPGPVLLIKKRGGLADVSTGLISSQKNFKKKASSNKLLFATDMSLLSALFLTKVNPMPMFFCVCV